MSQETIQNLAYEIGDYLARDVEPKNEEERLLRDMWNAADQNEQRVMAGLMVKMLNDGKNKPIFSHSNETPRYGRFVYVTKGFHSRSGFCSAKGVWYTI